MTTEERNPAEAMLDELAASLEYDEQGDSSIDSLIDYKNAVEGIVLALSSQLKAATDTLAEGVETDTEYWDALACGQDTEEAEASGYLIGYRDALEAVRLLVDNGAEDPTLAGYLDSVREEAEKQRDEITDLESAKA